MGLLACLLAAVTLFPVVGRLHAVACGVEEARLRRIVVHVLVLGHLRRLARVSTGAAEAQPSALYARARTAPALPPPRLHCLSCPPLVPVSHLPPTRSPPHPRHILSLLRRCTLYAVLPPLFPGACTASRRCHPPPSRLCRHAAPPASRPRARRTVSVWMWIVCCFRCSCHHHAHAHSEYHNLHPRQFYLYVCRPLVRDRAGGAARAYALWAGSLVGGTGHRSRVFCFPGPDPAGSVACHL